MNIRKAVRSAAVALIATVTLAGTTQAASAATSAQLTADLAALWTKVLETPSDQNPLWQPDRERLLGPRQECCRPVRSLGSQIVHGEARDAALRPRLVRRVQHVRGAKPTVRA